MQTFNLMIQLLMEKNAVILRKRKYS